VIHDNRPADNSETSTGLSVPDLTPDDTTLSAALAYANAGWYVVPIRRGTKHPGSVIGDRWQHQSSRDPVQLAEWFTGTDHGVALHVGRSGALVFDVDDPGKVPSVLSYWLSTDPRPPYQTTRRSVAGKGHFIYAVPHDAHYGNSPGQLGKGWGEVRGRNGIIVVTPSVHERAADGGFYAWRSTGSVPPLPEQLAELLPQSNDPAEVATDTEIQLFFDTFAREDYPGMVMAVCQRWEREIGDGGSRHDAMVSAACWAAREARGGAYAAARAHSMLRKRFLEAMVHTRPGSDRALSERQAGAEFDGIWAWAVAQAITADVGRIREKIEQQALQLTRGLAFDPPAGPGNHANPGADEGEEIGHTDPVDRLTAELLSPSDILNRPRPKSLIHGLLNMDSETWIIGEPGSFKSFVSLDVAAHIGTGLEWQRRRTVHGPVVYIVAEGVSGIGPRIAAWQETYGAMAGVHFLPRPVQALDEYGWSVLVEVCRRISPMLVVIDTQARVTVGMEENSARDMGMYVERVRALREATGACVLTVHHVGRNGGDARGSSAVDGAQTTELRVSREGKAYRAVITADKQKDMAEDARIHIDLSVINLGIDKETGDTLSSLAVIAAEEFDQPKVPIQPWVDELPKNQQQIISVLNDHGDDEHGNTEAQIRAWIKERYGEMKRGSYHTAKVYLIKREVVEPIGGVSRVRLADDWRDRLDACTNL
jgi:AAA domain-containing protein/bifunctional DNA primase/polymerase-like protein